MSVTSTSEPGPGSKRHAESLRRILESVLDVLLPTTCLACRAVAKLEIGLCPGCLELAERHRPTASCPGCGRPLTAASSRADSLRVAGSCGSCAARPPPYHRLLTFWSYEPPFDAVIRGLKFEHLEFLGSQLAERMLTEIFDRSAVGLERWRRGAGTRSCPDQKPGSTLEACDLVVPVPLHWRRRLRRGYNQAEAIARPLARGLGLPLQPLLKRVRATRPQTRFKRMDRASNLRGAFALRRGRSAPPQGRRVLLVDDVITTGATLGAAATALQAAGAEEVVALAAARTPDRYVSCSD